MKFIRGKRQFREEKLYGFVIFTSNRLHMRSFLFVIGHRAVGFQWLIRKS